MLRIFFLIWLQTNSSKANVCFFVIMALGNRWKHSSCKIILGLFSLWWEFGFWLLIWLAWTAWSFHRVLILCTRSYIYSVCLSVRSQLKCLVACDRFIICNGFAIMFTCPLTLGWCWSLIQLSVFLICLFINLIVNNAYIFVFV